MRLAVARATDARRHGAPAARPPPPAGQPRASQPHRGPRSRPRGPRRTHARRTHPARLAAPALAGAREPSQALASGCAASRRSRRTPPWSRTLRPPPSARRGGPLLHRPRGDQGLRAHRWQVAGFRSGTAALALFLLVPASRAARPPAAVAGGRLLRGHAGLLCAVEQARPPPPTRSSCSRRRPSTCWCSRRCCCTSGCAGATCSSWSPCSAAWRCSPWPGQPLCGGHRPGARQPPRAALGRLLGAHAARPALARARPRRRRRPGRAGGGGRQHPRLPRLPAAGAAARRHAAGRLGVDRLPGRRPDRSLLRAADPRHGPRSGDRGGAAAHARAGAHAALVLAGARRAPGRLGPRRRRGHPRRDAGPHPRRARRAHATSSAA